MQTPAETLILNALADLSGRLASLDNKVSEHITETTERLAKVEQKIDPLFDNGQPGEITVIKNDVSDLKSVKWRIIGAVAATSGFISAFVGLVSAAAWLWVHAKH